MKTPPEFTRREKAQSLVELALAFMVFMLLITGIVDVGSMFYTYAALQDTVQEGAIYGSVHPDPGSIVAHIQQSANYPIETSNLTDWSVKCNGNTCDNPLDTNSCQGNPITVTVGYTYRLVMPIIPVIIQTQTVVLKASVTDTILQSPNYCPK